MKKSISLFRFLIIISLSMLLCLTASAVSGKDTASKQSAFDSFVNSVRQDNENIDLSKIELYPGGMPFGVKITSRGLMVVGFSSTQGENASPAFLAGMRIGDVIIKLNEQDISTIQNFVSLVASHCRENITVTVLRGSKEIPLTFKPIYSSEDGTYKTGILVKDSTSGIGTVTFINPVTGAFGGLGHGICDSSSGRLVTLSKGTVLDVTINGVIKGKCGDAGELKGTFNSKRIGSLSRNSTSGVFGVISLNSITPPEKKMLVCPKEEIKEGEAYIWCTLDETGPHKYTVSISDIDLSSSSVKNYRVTVTDPALLEKTGGIVQGMSGSPIIQNGKIIGAVTHVLINNPTQGYGIFIENMLNSMPSILK